MPADVTIYANKILAVKTARKTGADEVMVVFQGTRCDITIWMDLELAEKLHIEYEE